MKTSVPISPSHRIVKQRSSRDPPPTNSEDTRLLIFISSPHMANSPLDSYWINLDEIRLWMHTCDTKHTCWAADTQTAVAWLIDVHRKCLIPCDPNTNYQYVALSYVWGQCPSSHTTMANLDAFQIPGVFSEKNPDVTIPKTIRHAIKLVGLLNIRYLWVDRFCICQDDAVSMHQQLWQMAYIYERAYLTLIAANGRDADHGLHGIKGVTKQRKLLASCEFKWTYWGELSHLASKWYTRGWTFQELFFSRRKLKFQSNVVLWECTCTVWHESTGVTGRVPQIAEDSILKTPDTIRITPWGPWSTKHPMVMYREMLSQYNRRKLTHASDRMRAFAGVTTKLEAYFPGGFIWGLPVANFEIALLWQNSQGSKRRDQKCPDHTKLPSWSWVGWGGDIKGSYWDVDRLDIRIVRSEDAVPTASVNTVQRLVIPCCEWHCTTLNGTFPVVSDFRLTCQPELGQVREGLRDQQDDLHPFLRTRTKVVKCTLSALANDRTANITDCNGSKEYDSVIGSIFLRSSYSTDMERQGCELMLLSKSLTRKASGVTWLEALSDYCKYYDSEVKQRELQELQELQEERRGKRQERRALQALRELQQRLRGLQGRQWQEQWHLGARERWELKEKDESNFDTLQAYNVLWITQRDGIAYREALGIVSMEAFDSIPGEMMDIVL
ncbi:heterokaryon incompatibility protein-domain-containing protein, partial [Hypoxylon rubiginosum]